MDLIMGSVNLVGYFLRRRRRLNLVVRSRKMLGSEVDLRKRMHSPLTRPLKTERGWAEENSKYWNVLVGLKYVFMSRTPVVRK